MDCYLLSHCAKIHELLGPVDFTEPAGFPRAPHCVGKYVLVAIVQQAEKRARQKARSRSEKPIPCLLLTFLDQCNPCNSVDRQRRRHSRKPRSKSAANTMSDAIPFLISYPRNPCVLTGREEGAPESQGAGAQSSHQREEEESRGELQGCSGE